MGQKDASGFLAPFRGLARSITAVPIPGAHEAPRPPEELARMAAGVGFSVDTAGSVPEAIVQIEKAPGQKRILICGSLYLAGHVLAFQQGVKTQSN
jgi:dihydrofolate synthase/folylpolyglutamate synthase